jgi:hypothetical protein
MSSPGSASHSRLPPHLARQVGHLRAGDHQQLGVIGYVGMLGKVEVLHLQAHAAQFAAELAQVMVGRAERIALAMAGEEQDPALALTRQAQQGIGERLFAELLHLLAASLVVQQQLAVEGDAQLAHLFRVGVGIDEFQRHIGLDALVASHEFLDGAAQRVVLAGEGGDAHRVVQFGQQLAAVLGEGIAAACGPVGLVRIAGAEPGQGADHGQEQHYENDALGAQPETGFGCDFHDRFSARVGRHPGGGCSGPER